jgi:shikimate kinase
LARTKIGAFGAEAREQNTYVKPIEQASEIMDTTSVKDVGRDAVGLTLSSLRDTPMDAALAAESRADAIAVDHLHRAGMDIEKRIASALGRRSIVLVGLMGCGKTSVGRKLSQRLGLSFVDADEEIERAANKSIPEIFAEHGEPYFRDGERRVIARLLRSGPQVLATGGGAFMSVETRAAIAAAGISVWLRAELPVLMKRVARRANRPLLRSPDPEGTMRALMEARYPIYAEADIPVDSSDVSHEVMAETVLRALWASGRFGR